MPDKNDILIYNMPNGNSNVEVYLCDEDIWMTQAGLADLFQTSIANISMHIRNIYKAGELSEESTIKLDLKVQKEGLRTVKRTVKLYNLKMVIAIGMRVKSSTATSFRVWANGVLREYMVKGFAMDDRRLEDPERFGKDYFDELYLRIRAIRASEKRFYQKVLDIYSTSVDYNANDEQTIRFFNTVQNKLHFAISG